MDRELAVKNLRAVKEVFDELGIRFWLDGGTLLGAVRDGEILEWDNDIDLGMWSNDGKKLLLAINELKRRKVALRMGYPLYPNTQMVKLSLYPFDCDIDIFLWQVKDDEIINLYPAYKGSRLPINSILYVLRIARHYLFCDLALSVPEKPIKHVANILELSLPLLPMKLKTFLLRMLLPLKLGHVNWILLNPRRHFEKLETLKFYGTTFSVPYDVEDFLRYHYGENWRIPQKKWEWTKDDRAPLIKR
jgi:hypothetical protein